MVEGHSDLTSEPMLSTGEVQRQVHGSNKDAVSAGSMSVIFVSRPSGQNVWCMCSEMSMTHALGCLFEVVLLTHCQQLAFVVVSNTISKGVRTQQAFGVPLAFIDHHAKLVCLFSSVQVNVCAVDLPVDEPLLNFRSFEVQGIWVECTECFPHGVSPILAESVVVGVSMCCADDAHMIAMCDAAHILRNHKHSLSVVASRVRRLRGHGRCICMLAVVECGCVLLVKGNEYPALPRTANAVAVTAFHAVRDARLGDMSGAADKRTVVAVHGKFMQSHFHRLPSPHNVVLHPRHNRTRHPWLSGMAWIVLRQGLGFRVRVVGQFTKEMSWTAIWEQRHACAARARE